MRRGLIKVQHFYNFYAVSFSVAQASLYFELIDAGNLPASAQSVIGTGNNK